MTMTLDLNLTDQEKAQLAGILKCQLANLEQEYAKFASAASQEYARMILGQKVFTRGSDILEYRLFLLIRHAFGDQIPDEQHVCDLFQTTASQSRSLVRSVISKYQYELTDARASSIKNAIASVKLVNNELLLELTSGSTNIIEVLNQAIASINGLLQQISKRRDTVSAYIIDPTSYRELCKKYGVNPVEGAPSAG